MNFLAQFPDPDELLITHGKQTTGFPLKVNNHIHTPFSFSAFESIQEAVQMAANEDVRVLGINDFYVTDGFGEFITRCEAQAIFPLLNIELIGISKRDQEDGIRINDPGNPGRIYISGKGLAFPSVLEDNLQEKLDAVVVESNNQVGRMIDLLNRWLGQQQMDIRISEGEIRAKLAMQLLRERHVAKAIRLKLEEKAGSDDEFYQLIQKVYGGNPTERKREDIAGLEEELRGRLLKSGAPAFVPEDERAFLEFDEIVKIIKNAGGIPTYPMLLDGAGGKITEFENGKEQLLRQLDRKGIYSVELIPLRNRYEVLKEYAEYFYDNGFVVSFGTEHNTTAMRPVTVSCLNNVPLDDSLKQISFRGAAFVAAHQYLVTREGDGYDNQSRDQMENLGQAVLQYYFKSQQNETHG